MCVCVDMHVRDCLSVCVDMHACRSVYVQHFFMQVFALKKREKKACHVRACLRKRVWWGKRETEGGMGG